MLFNRLKEYEDLADYDEALDDVEVIIDEIAEQMKEVGE